MSDMYEAVFTWPHPEPKTVILTGTFDHWSGSVHMTKGPTGFTATVKVPYGEKVYYKFIVDGEWQLREFEPTEPDRRGLTNNYLTIPSKPPGNGTASQGSGSAIKNATLEPIKGVAAKTSFPKLVTDWADTIAAGEGARNPLSYVASGLGVAIQSVVGYDPINSDPISIPTPATATSNRQLGQLDDRTPVQSPVHTIAPIIPMPIIPVNDSSTNSGLATTTDSTSSTHVPEIVHPSEVSVGAIDAAAPAAEEPPAPAPEVIAAHPVQTESEVAPTPAVVSETIAAEVAAPNAEEVAKGVPAVEEPSTHSLPINAPEPAPVVVVVTPASEVVKTTVLEPLAPAPAPPEKDIPVTDSAPVPVVVATPAPEPIVAEAPSPAVEVVAVPAVVEPTSTTVADAPAQATPATEITPAPVAKVAPTPAFEVAPTPATETAPIPAATPASEIAETTALELLAPVPENPQDAVAANGNGKAANGNGTTKSPPSTPVKHTKTDSSSTTSSPMGTLKNKRLSFPKRSGSPDPTSSPTGTIGRKKRSSFIQKVKHVLHIDGHHDEKHEKHKKELSTASTVSSTEKTKEKL